MEFYSLFVEYKNIFGHGILLSVHISRKITIHTCKSIDDCLTIF